MTSPCAGKLVGALFSDEEIASQRGGYLRLWSLLSPCQVRRLVLGIVLQEGQQDPDLKIFIGQLIDLGDAVCDQDCVVGDAFEQRCGARVHGEDRGLESSFAAYVQVLKIGERGDVAGNDFVADQLLELGIGN